MIVITDGIENALLSALIGLFFSIGAFYFARNRVKNAILGMINAYILDFLAKTKENPQVIAEIMMPVINELLKRFKTGKDGQMPVGSMMGGGIEMLIPMLPRKWQGIAAIGSMFLNRDKKKGESGSNSQSWG